MAEPLAFCRAVMHDYERQWSRASGHALRHPLRLKIERLKDWCDNSCSADEFEKRLLEAERSDDVGLALLGEELLPLWRTVSTGGSLPTTDA